MDQIRYPIDPYKPVEEQARDIVKLLRPILPLKIEQVKVAIKIPTQYAARAYGTVKTLGTIKQEEWRGDGSWYGELELPAGRYASLISILGDETKGMGEAKINS